MRYATKEEVFREIEETDAAAVIADRAGTKWVATRLTKMDAALADIEPIAENIAAELRSIAAALRELDKIEDREARRAVAGGLAIKVSQQARNAEEIGKIVNEGLTVRNLETGKNEN